MPTNRARARSLAFFEAPGEVPELSIVLEIKEPIVAVDGAAHLYIKLSAGQVALLLRESAIYTAAQTGASHAVAT